MYKVKYILTNQDCINVVDKIVKINLHNKSINKYINSDTIFCPFGIELNFSYKIIIDENLFTNFIFDDDYIIFSFNTEEEALYFKLKYC